MLWGSFGIVHITTLLLSAGICVGLYFWLRRCSQKLQTIVLGVLSFSGIAAVIYNLAMWNSPLEYLPFHLCSLSALVLPFAVFMRSKVLNNLLLLWAFGAFCALVVNNAQANFEIFSWTFAFYYFPHTLELAIPILMFLLKLVQKDIKCIFSTVAITFISFTLIHFINLAINSYCVSHNVLDYAVNIVQVNYMYTLFPENPVMQIFYNLIPYEYWYLLLCLPVVVVYLSCVYCKELIAWVKMRKKSKSA